jgi:hypothetical protein
MKWLFVSLGILALGGFALMLANFIERPNNDSGGTQFGMSGRQWREWNAPWPPENERLSHKLRRWWERL